jgi:hypothetical protein
LKGGRVSSQKSFNGVGLVVGIFVSFSNVLAISMFEKLERGKGERTAWQIFDDATDTFVRLSETPAVIGDQDMECIEAFCSHPVRQDYDNVCREQCTFRNVCLEAIPV